MKTTISDRYEVNLTTKEDVIGRGGQAVVYRGFDRILQTRIAIKVYKLVEYSENIRALQEQYAQLERFYHPNVINYYDWAVFTHQKKILFALIMNYADLGTLDSYHANLNTGRMEKIDQVFTGVLNGLKHIHRQGIVHRDLKPSNVLLASEEDDHINALLADILFEANNLTQDEKVATAHFAGIFGTIEYMAPELLGTRNVLVGPASDIWSFGVMVYEFFMGKLPFGSRAGNTSPVQVAQAILTESVDVSGLPQPYNYVVSACLEKDISNRISDAGILIDIIEKYRSGGSLHAPVTRSSKEIHSPKMPESPTAATIVGFVNIRKQPQADDYQPATMVFQAATQPVFGTMLMPDTVLASAAPTMVMVPSMVERRITIVDPNYAAPAAGPVNMVLLDQIQQLKEKIEDMERDQAGNSATTVSFSRMSLQELIARNEIAECFSELNKVRDSFSHQLNKTYIMIRAEWSELKMQEMHGIIEDNLLKTGANKLRYKLLNFIDLVEINS
ncbi:MAG: protein kinase [Saprospiraceae bacterium]|nr:serine/threonine protein kinase [Lewinella sp.]